MSVAELQFDGLAELIEELLALPAEYTAEASHIIEGWANSAAVDIRGAYGERAARLRDKVDVVLQTDAGQFAASARVRCNDPLAYIYENGSEARHTALGAFRGSMPPAHAFVPIVMQKRRAMYAELKELIARHGLEADGEETETP